jgi:hypothetical protein
MTLSAKLISMKKNSRTTMVHAPFCGVGLAIGCFPYNRRSLSGAYRICIARFQQSFILPPNR